MKWTLSSITVLFNFHILGCAVCEASPPLLRPQPFILSKRAWSSIARFFDNCKKKIKGKKGFPKFKKHSRSVEYKQSGWKLDEQTKKHITFTDKNNIGRVKLVGSRDIYF
ncbi:MAG: hypothetical protein QNJ32_15705 [Xenococcaceae cyanobacterium MO_167.B27]|nr:hypothetical protein [Xenococcaceae cyanobacterium MO_167.B27]